MVIDIKEAVAVLWEVYRPEAVIFIILLIAALADGIYEVIRDQFTS